MNNIIIKTMKDWKQNFSDDFQPGDRVDEGIYQYFLNVLPPLTNKIDMLQVSEPYGWDEKGRSTYTTFTHDGTSWIYRGHCIKGGVTHID